MAWGEGWATGREAVLLLTGILLGAALGVPAAVAATKITGKDVKNSSLTGKDVRDGSLTSADLAQTYVWRATVRSDQPNLSTQSIPAGSIVTPVRAEFLSQQCEGSPVNNPEAASFQISLVDGLAETGIVNHPLTLSPQSTGAMPDRLKVALPGCGGVVTAQLEFVFEVRAGGSKKTKPFG